MSSRTKTPSRLLLTVAFAISAMLLGIIGAVAAGTGTVTPPPKIAFVASNVTGSPDALTVGPMAGRLGAPLFITNKEALGEATRDALVAYGADLIIVAGGPGSVTNDVLTQISTATGKTIKDIADTPTDGIVRVHGTGRDQTAAELAKLITAYNPKFLPVDATAVGAVDADKLDGLDSTDMLSFPFAVNLPLIVTPHDNETDLQVRHLGGSKLVTAATTGSHDLVLDLSGPIVRGGTQIARITQIQVCYHVANAADEIHAASLYSGVGVVQNFSLSWNSTVNPTCQTLAVNALPAGSNSIGLGLRLSFFRAGGGSGDLYVHGVSVTYDRP